LAWAAASGALLLGAKSAAAAPPWVSRGMVQPKGVWAIDAGVGVGHRPDITGAGLNVEVAGGLTHSLELGFRTGFRFGSEGESLQVDNYGRLFNTENFGTGHDVLANPEVWIRDVVARGQVVELGLEGRVYLPIENGTRAGLMFGLPLAFHFGTVRLDTGVFVPVLFYDPVRTVVSVPIQLWIEASRQFWLGPIAAVHIRNDPDAFTQVLLGFGLGYQLSREIDFKAQFIFPYINGNTENGDGTHSFGAGAGLQFRIE